MKMKINMLESDDVVYVSPVQFIMLTYIFMLAWLGVTAFTSLPVFMYFNVWNICQNTTAVDNLCLDLRQFGVFCSLWMFYMLFRFN